MTFTDNFGILFASIFQVPSTGSPAFQMKNTTGGFPSFQGYKDRDFDDHWNQTNPNPQSYAQVGKGSTPATRQDFQIENPFTNGGVEDNKKLTSLFGYNSPLGKITIQTGISPTAGSGTITEVVKINQFVNTNGITISDIVMTRDNPTPTGFISGKSINLEHIIEI